VEAEDALRGHDREEAVRVARQTEQLLVAAAERGDQRLNDAVAAVLELLALVKARDELSIKLGRRKIGWAPEIFQGREPGDEIYQSAASRAAGQLTKVRGVNGQPHGQHLRAYAAGAIDFWAQAEGAVALAPTTAAASTPAPQSFTRPASKLAPPPAPAPTQPPKPAARKVVPRWDDEPAGETIEGPFAA
jgi:hypothetical protein